MVCWSLGQIDGQMDGRLVSQTDGRMVSQLVSQSQGRTDEQTDRQLVCQTDDGQMKSQLFDWSVSLYPTV